jgi:glyoxylase-like metal-dependent hydrolase (beta-lactamase superfamily II)
MQTWTLGDVKITAVLEQQVALPCDFLLPASTAPEVQAIDWLAPAYATAAAELILWIQAFVLDTPTKRIVVDTCMGNDKPRTGLPDTDFLQRFEAAGFARGSVDVVLCTHLHNDHVGWNTRLEDGRWVPTFPNARYLIGKAEHGHWSQNLEGDDALILQQSVEPLLDAKLVDLVESDHAICPEVRLIPTPGHTPGHVSVAIESGGRRGLITGDMIHNPAQVARPEWGCFADDDGARAAATRRDVLERLVDQPVLVLGTHFPEPTGGAIVRDGARYRFRA